LRSNKQDRKQPAKPSKRTVPETEAAAACGVNRSTLRRWRSEGCPALVRPGKGGGSAFYDLAEIKAWLLAQGRSGARGKPAEGTLPAMSSSPADKGRAVSVDERMDIEAIRKATALAVLQKTLHLARRHELANLERERRLVDISELHEGIGILASTIRGLGEDLQRRAALGGLSSDEVAQAFEERLDEFGRAIRNMAAPPLPSSPAPEPASA